jgi:hypothetical protein
VIVLSPSLVLAATEPLGTPVIGWRSIVTAGTISASSTESGRTAADLANPSTVLFWRAAAYGSPPADVYITLDVAAVDPIDYLAVAGHNFGSAGIAVSLEIATALTGSPAALNWTQVTTPRLVARDDPLIFRFTPQTVLGVRLRLQPGTAPPQAAVVYAGRLLVMPRGTSDGHVPINYARTTRRLRQVSNNGHFLGEVLLAEGRQNAIAFKHLAQEWFRSSFVPFLDAATTQPFFFAWRPQAWPDDVGFVTLTNDPQPSIDFDTATIGLDLQMEGVAL